MKDSSTLVYVGTYTRGESEGIYIYRLDLFTGALEHVSTVPSGDNPSFLAFDPSQSHLYAVNEVMEFEGSVGGAISAFAIDAQSGGLTFLNRQATHGGAPCHLTVDQTGQFVLAANYMGGNVTVLPVQGDGQVGPASDLIQHEGSSINPQRQGEPHAHSINLDPANRYAYAADLGIDKVIVYQLDLSQGKLFAQTQIEVEAGSGPRHFTFHPNGEYAYLINEMGSTITTFAHNEDTGKLTTVQTVPTLPSDFDGKSTTADIHITPAGNFLYGSNRGHDSLVIYAIDEGTGRLTYVGHESTQGKTPRNFGIDPSGTFLLAANQDSDSIVVFRIDQESGRLTATGQQASVPMPVCLIFS